MGFFDFLKGKTPQNQIDKTMNKLQELLEKKEVQDALIQSQTFGTVGIGQMTYLKQVNDLIYELSELTGKTPEEIFNNPTNLKSEKDRSMSFEDEQYLDILITWANKYNLPELKIQEHMTIAGGYYDGFPRDKEKLFNLHTLNLPNCNLDELPKEIGKLRNLKKLWLDGNNLTELPNEICNLSSLEELYMPNNEIDKLPENIGNLCNLVEINFENNNIKYLPISAILLKKLHKINFRSQKHGRKLSTPTIASLILSGVFEQDTEFRKRMFMIDDTNWNNLKEQFRTKYQNEIKIDINGRDVPYLSLVEDVFGKEIANAQGDSSFYNICKF